MAVMNVVENDHGDGHGDHDCSQDDHGILVVLMIVVSDHAATVSE
jgi:hypothetical protein